MKRCVLWPECISLLFTEKFIQENNAICIKVDLQKTEEILKIITFGPAISKCRRLTDIAKSCTGLEKFNKVSRNVKTKIKK